MLYNYHIKTTKGVTMKSYAAAVRNKETNHISYYTGKAGGDYLSPKKEEAFFAYSEGYAMKRAESLAEFFFNLEPLAICED